MHRYGQFCPIAIACEILTERWTPLILRELMSGKHLFNEIMRGLPLISRTLLADRLRELEQVGLVKRIAKTQGRGYEYHLTESGAGVQPVIMQLGEWGREWIYPAVMKKDLDPVLLMWDIHHRLHTERLPEQRTVVEFNLKHFPKTLPSQQRAMKRWWLLLEKPDVQLCLSDPGYEIDLVVNADLFALTQVWMGERKLNEVVSEGKVSILGSRSLVKAFPDWLKLSVFAG